MKIPYQKSPRSSKRSKRLKSHYDSAIILPTHNEEHNISELITKIHSLKLRKNLIIVIDDASTDQTAIVANGFRSRVDLVVTSRDQKFGLGSAYLKGFEAALKYNCQKIVTMDADLSHDPKTISEILKQLDNYHLVIGSRYCQGGIITGLSLWRYLLSRSAQFLYKYLLNLPTTDSTSGFRGYHAKLLNGLHLQMAKSSGYSFLSESLHKITESRYTVTEIPINFGPRQHGKSKVTLKEIIDSTKTIFRLYLGTKYTKSESTLRKILLLKNYNNWTFRQLLPHIKGRVLEAGSGIGCFTEKITHLEVDLTCLDSNSNHLKLIPNAISPTKSVTLIKADLNDKDISKIVSKSFDTIICQNVLEHIKNDGHTLESFFRLLRPGGKLITLVPAHQQIYGSLDKQLGHHRRYNKQTLTNRLTQKGFRVESTKYFNTLGIIGWILQGKIFKNPELHTVLLRLFDLLIPFFHKLESIIDPPFGLSLITISSKPHTKPKFQKVS